MIRDLISEDQALKHFTSAPRSEKPRFDWARATEVEEIPTTGDRFHVQSDHAAHTGRFDPTLVADTVGEALTDLLLSRKVEEDSIYSDPNRRLVARIARAVSESLLARAGASGETADTPISVSANDISALIERALIKYNEHDVAKSFAMRRHHELVAEMRQEEAQSEAARSNTSGPRTVRVIRRSGEVVAWNPAKIENAVRKAFLSLRLDSRPAAAIGKAITARIQESGQEFIHIEDVQDRVQEELMRAGEFKVAETYILYRAHRNEMRADEDQAQESLQLDQDAGQQSLLLSSFEGSASPQWLAGMLSMIDQLDGIKDPILKVTGQDVILSGSVTAEQIRRAKVATAKRLLGADLNFIDNLTVAAPTTVAPEAPEVTDTTETADETEKDIAKAETTKSEEQAVEVTVAATKAPQTNAAATPAKRPASIEINSKNNQIQLNGFVGSEADASGIRQGLDNLFGIDGYFDELEISETVESAYWIDDALVVTSEIRDVPEFALNIRAGQMSLSGSVTDRETARDLSIAATEIAGGKLGVLNNFSIDNAGSSNNPEDLMALSLLQELEALPTNKIVFNKNSTTLADSAKEVLDDVAAAILGYTDLVVEIAGHTDSSGDAVTNLRLSKERATAVQDYLVEKNVPGSRLSPIGYGETAPISDNETDAGRAANRRIEFNL